MSVKPAQRTITTQTATIEPVPSAGIVACRPRLPPPKHGVLAIGIAETACSFDRISIRSSTASKLRVRRWQVAAPRRDRGRFTRRGTRELFFRCRRVHRLTLRQMSVFSAHGKPPGVITECARVVEPRSGE